VQPKTYCRSILLLVLVALAFIATFNMAIDPLGAYPSVHAKAFEPQRATHFSRTARGELARRGVWQIAVFGTSRPKAGMPLHHPAFATNRVCNLAVDATRMSETTAMLEYTARRNPLRHVLLCLDLAMFRASTFFTEDFAESRFNTNTSLFEYHCRGLIGANTIDQSCSAVLDVLRGQVPPEGERNGFHVRALKSGASHRALFEKTLRSLAYGYAAQTAASGEMQALRRAVEMCRERQIDLALAINPVHALDLELLAAGNKWKHFEQWKRDVTRIVAESGSSHVALWDFTGYWPPTTEEVPPAGDTATRMKFYFENSHYTPAMGALMLDRIFLGNTNQFGAKISAETIDDHLRLIRAQREAYVRTHTAEVQWVQRISKQAVSARQGNTGPEEEME
jgi:hypothetical protein